LDQVFNVSIGRRVAPKDPAESDHIFKVEVTRWTVIVSVKRDREIRTNTPHEHQFVWAIERNDLVPVPYSDLNLLGT